LGAGCVKRLGLTIAVLFTAAAALAKDELVVSARVNPQGREQAWKIYIAACTTMEREFGATHLLRPRIVLVLSAQNDRLDWEQSEIRLREWDPYLFTQEVMALAYRQLMLLHAGPAQKERFLKWCRRTAEGVVDVLARRGRDTRNANHLAKSIASAEE
jgi:hypothetical protein